YWWPNPDERAAETGQNAWSNRQSELVVRAPAQLESPLSISLAKIWDFARLGPRSSATRRERQRLYFQYTPHYSRQRKTTVGRNVLLQTVTCLFYKPLCTTHPTALRPRVSFNTPRPFML